MARSTKSRRKPKAPKRREGRPSLYDPVEHPRLAHRVMREGKTLGELAEILEINRSTMDDWRERHPEFSGMIKLGQEDALDNIEASMHQRAIGYKVPIVKPMSVAIGDGCSTIRMVDVVEHFPPDVAAAKFVLTNRRRHLWSDKQKLEHTGTLTLEQMLKESWAKAEEKSAPAETPKVDA